MALFSNLGYFFRVQFFALGASTYRSSNQESEMAKRIVIYGGSGGIGSVTARLLRAQGNELHLVGRNEQKLSSISSELQAGYTQGDVCDENLFSEVARDFPGPYLPFV